MRGRQRDANRCGDGLPPPIQLLDTSYSGFPHEPPVPERRHHDRVEAARQGAQRPDITVIVVIVAEQDHRDRRQRVEANRRASNTPRPQQAAGTCAFCIHRIRQDVARGRLNEKRRVTDECHDDLPGACRGYFDHRLLDACRPRSAPHGNQHLRHGGERLQRRSCGIEEPPAVEMIAPIHDASLVSAVPTLSMTSTSTGPFVDSSFSPSCSCSAVNSDGASGSGAGTSTPAAAGRAARRRNVSSNSQLPARPVRSTTIRPDCPPSIVVSCEIGKPAEANHAGAAHDAARHDAARRNRGGPAAGRRRAVRLSSAPRSLSSAGFSAGPGTPGLTSVRA